MKSYFKRIPKTSYRLRNELFLLECAGYVK